MLPRRSIGVSIALTGLIAGIFALCPTTAQVKQGKSRPMLTRHLMKGLVSLHCSELKKALDATPASNDDWQNVELRAALLNEASFILMDDGRCPDAVWANAASKKLRGGSADILTAAKQKDLESAKKAFDVLSGACKDCHGAHKKRKK